ncbi:MAG: hypothetical protein WCJ61_09690 [Paludibacter sp.]
MKRYIVSLLVLVLWGCKNNDEPQIIKKDIISKFVFINNSNMLINKINFRTWVYFPKENSTRYINNWGYNMGYGDSLTLEIKDQILYKDCIYQNMISWEEKDVRNDIKIHEYISNLDTLKEIIPENFIINWPSDSVHFQMIQ